MSTFICVCFGHKYKHVRYGKFMKAWQLVECTRCDREFIVNHSDHSMLEADRELKLAMNGELK